MIAQDLLELLRIRPFRTFRIHGTDGRVREVYHPDEALVLRTRVILPLGNQGGSSRSVGTLGVSTHRADRRTGDHRLMGSQ